MTVTIIIFITIAQPISEKKIYYLQRDIDNVERRCNKINYIEHTFAFKSLVCDKRNTNIQVILVHTILREYLWYAE